MPLMSSLGIDFGKALQMTNILRDLPSDIREGRCYIPDEELKKLNFPIKPPIKYIKNIPNLDEINGNFIEELEDKRR